MPTSARPRRPVQAPRRDRPARLARRLARPGHASRPPRRSATATATRSGSCRSTARTAASPASSRSARRNDGHARWSPDGRTIAFLSDRRHLVEEEPDAGDKKDREDGSQVHLLSLDGGEARRLTDLPRGVDGFEWSPDGSKLVVTLDVAPGEPRRRPQGSRHRPRGASPATRPSRTTATSTGSATCSTGRASSTTTSPTSGSSTSATGEATRADGRADRRRRPGLVARRHADRLHDAARSRLRHLASGPTSSSIDVETGKRTRITGGPEPIFFVPAWLPDGTTIATLGGRLPAQRLPQRHLAVRGRRLARRRRTAVATSRAATTSCRAPAMNSDITPGEGSRLISSADGRWLSFLAPRDGAYQLWRIATTDGSLEQLTTGRHYLSSFDQVEPRPGRPRTAFIRSAPTELPDVWVRTARRRDLRRVTSFNAEALADVELRRAARAARRRSTAATSRAGSSRVARRPERGRARRGHS